MRCQELKDKDLREQYAFEGLGYFVMESLMMSRNKKLVMKSGMMQFRHGSPSGCTSALILII